MQGDRITKASLKKKNKVEELTLPNFKTQNSVYWHKDRQTGQWNRINRNKRLLLWLIYFQQGSKTIQWGSSTNGAGTT